MNPDQRIFLIGLYINSALYLTACAGIGFLTGNGIAWKLAVAAFGFCWIGYYSNVDGRIPRLIGLGAGIGSIFLGVCAGLALLIF